MLSAIKQTHSGEIERNMDRISGNSYVDSYADIDDQ